MANIVKADQYNTSVIVGKCRTERNRKINRRKSAVERRRLRDLDQDERSDSRSDRILLFVR